MKIHGAHGYVLSQFRSSPVDRRDERYGGDRERRLALPCAVRAAIGPDLLGPVRSRRDQAVPITTRTRTEKSGVEWLFSRSDTIPAGFAINVAGS